MQPSTLQETQTEAGIVALLATAASSREIISQHNVPILLTPNGNGGVDRRSLEHLRDTPLRPSVHVKLATSKDLHQYLANQANWTRTENPLCGSTSEPPLGLDNVVVFADRDKLNFHAFLDYHHVTGGRWLNHSASVTYKESHQFGIWKKHDGVKMGQEAFAEFLDENVLDITDPTGADVVAFASCLEAHRTEIFKSSTNLGNGEVKFNWSNESSGDSVTKFPTDMKIGIPIWTNGEKILIPVKLFYRVSEGKLLFWYKLRNLENIIDQLWNEDVKFISEALLSIGTVYQGLPPSAPSPQPI
jgi:uncharacterized protein YfdQ (DUF2303 family)